MSIIVRLASVDDVSAMRCVRNAVTENSLSHPEVIPYASYLPFVEAGSIWVAEDGSEVVRFAAIDKSARSVWALFVDPAAEHAGVGRALHAQMLFWAKEQGLERLALTTAKQTRAASFYRVTGWVEVGTTSSGEAAFERSLGL